MINLVSTCLFMCLFASHQSSGQNHISKPDRSPVRHIQKVNPAKPERTDPYWQKALQEVYKSPEELAAQDVREKRRGLVLPKLARGNPAQKILALTFDDGPHPGLTEKLLAILKAKNVKATFFVVGKMVEKQPDLLRRIEADGHVIGNHSFSHVTLTKIPTMEIAAEYRATNDLVKKILGKPLRFCRPPGGDYDQDVIQTATELGLTTVLWTDDPGDYANPGDSVIQGRVLRKLTNGGIILLHDGITQTLKILPQVIDYAHKHGFRFETIDELARSVRQKKVPVGLALPNRQIHRVLVV